MDSKTAGTILMRFSSNLQISPAGDPVKFIRDRLYRITNLTQLSCCIIQLVSYGNPGLRKPDL